MSIIPVLIDTIFNLIILIILIGCLLSFIPNIQWQNEPFRTIRLICDAIFGPFRKIIPPIGGFDLSPIFAIIVIDLIKKILIEIMH